MVRVRLQVAVLLLGVSVAGTASAADISGTISSPVTIAEDSQLVGNVTCRVTGAACITFGAPGISLKLNGFSMTGQGDPVAGCAGGQAAGEHGILINGLRGVIVQGPGVVQQFRAHGIIVTGASSRVFVTHVTAATNCMSGIIVTGASSDNDVHASTFVNNGNGISPCGGL